MLTFSTDPSVAFFLKGVLDCDGFSVTAVAQRPGEVLTAVRRVRPCLIVYDVRQPAAENCDVLRRLTRARAHHVPVVITTSDPGALREATGLGATLELAGAPDDVRAVREAVRQVVDTASARPAA